MGRMTEFAGCAPLTSRSHAPFAEDVAINAVVTQADIGLTVADLRIARTAPGLGDDVALLLELLAAGRR